MTDTTDNSWIDDMSSFEPLLTLEDIDEAEQLEQERSVKRRLMLVTLTKSANELFAMAEQSPDVAKEMFKQVNDHIRSTRALLEMSNACSTRLLASLNHAGSDDFVALVSEWATATGVVDDNFDKG